MSNVLLVSDLSFSGMRDSVRLKNLVREAAPDAAVDFVAVEGQDKRTTIDLGDFERGIESKIAFVVPFDARTTADAANNSKAVPATAGGRKPLLKSFKRIAEQIAGDTKSMKRKGWFRK